ncbi:MAG: UDP-N-acetylmuramoyl-L-alanine--D-glutamate ligase [Oligoflexus sp.]
MAKPVLILGAGRSGFGAAKYLMKKGLPCLVSDIKSPSAELATRFAEIGAKVIIGPQESHLLDDISQVVVSPGISSDIKILQEAKRRQLTIRSEIDLSLAQSQLPWIGITGTNGKSTCTHWLNEILQGLNFRSVELGNIGVSPSEILADRQDFDFLVVELSSYQIDSSHILAPKISFFTSFSPDHLERHGSLEQYFQAKWKLLCQTKETGYCLLTEEIWQLSQAFQVSRPKAHLIILRSNGKLTEPQAGVSYLDLDESNLCLSFQGERVSLSPHRFYQHEFRNVAMCLVAARLMTKVSWSDLVRSLTQLTRLPYRFQMIGSWQGKPVINDSKATNVESTLVAVSSLNQECYLLLGGRAKKESFEPLMDYKSILSEILVYGESQGKIVSDLQGLQLSRHTDLAAALKHLNRLMEQRPLSVLFSPACASFDGFENFEARGLYFNQAVQAKLDPSVSKTT